MQELEGLWYRLGSGPSIVVRRDAVGRAELLVPTSRWWMARDNVACPMAAIKSVEERIDVAPWWGLVAVATVVIALLLAVNVSVWLAVLLAPGLVGMWAAETGTLVLVVSRVDKRKPHEFRLCRSSEERTRVLREFVQGFNEFFIRQRDGSRSLRMVV